MTLHRFSLDYEACTDAELMRFIKDRRLETSGFDHNNSSYLQPNELDHDSGDRFCGLLNLRGEAIEVLRGADRAATFRFSDFAGELRNRVYECLLNLQPDGKDGRFKCWTAILATSRKDYNEAGSFLYIDKVFHVMMDERQILVPDSSKTYWRVHPSTNESQIDMPLVFKPFTWPLFLHKARNVKLG